MLGVYGFENGDKTALLRLTTARDFKGRFCGHDKGVEDFSLAFWALPANGTPAPATWTAATLDQLQVVCTKLCPRGGARGQAVQPREADLCPGDSVDNGENWCAWYGGNTTKLAGYCVDASIFGDIATTSSEKWIPSAGEWIPDIQASARILLTVPFVAVLSGMAFLSFVHHCGVMCIWGTLLLVAIVPAVTGIWVYDHASGSHGPVSSSHGIDSFKPSTQRQIAIALLVLSAIMMLLVCLFAGAVKSIVQVLRSTSKFLEDVPSQMLQPLAFGLVQMLVLAIGLILFVQVASIGVEKGDRKQCLVDGDLYCLEWTSQVQWLGLAYILFVTFWVVNFKHALSHFATSFAVYKWFFVREDPLTGRKMPHHGGHHCCDFRLTARGVFTGLARNPGSLAFGALLVSIARIGRFLLWWVFKKEEQRDMNPVGRCAARCLNCLAGCMERCIEFVTEHAYVEVAIQSKGFCASARKAMALTIEKPALFALVGRVAGVIRCMGVVLVVAISSFWTICGLIVYRPPVTGLTVPMVVAAVGSFLVGEVMMHPFTAAARAALHCLVLDEERSSLTMGGDVAPVYTPQHLQALANHYHGQEVRSHGCCCCR